MSEYDKFLKAYRIESNLVGLHVCLSEVVVIQFISIDTALTLHLSSSGNTAGTVTTREALIFLCDNDSIITLYPKSTQILMPSRSIKTYNHNYAITKQQIETLQKSRVVNVRIYRNNGFADTKVKANRWDNFTAMAASFLKEYADKTARK